MRDKVTLSSRNLKLFILFWTFQLKRETMPRITNHNGMPRSIKTIAMSVAETAVQRKTPALFPLFMSMTPEQ